MPHEQTCFCLIRGDPGWGGAVEGHGGRYLTGLLRSTSAYLCLHFHIPGSPSVKGCSLPSEFMCNDECPSVGDREVHGGDSVPVKSPVLQELQPVETHASCARLASQLPSLSTAWTPGHRTWSSRGPKAFRKSTTLRGESQTTKVKQNICF